MTAPVGLGLARVTVAAPKRRIDVALPDNALLGELLPHLLRHAGEDLADEGEAHGGWVLRRTTGVALEPTRSLTAQGVRDGETLRLVPRRLDWPELAYDDVVEVVASGARRAGRSWGNPATRRCGLAVAAVLLLAGLLVVLSSGPPWPLPGGVALGVAAALALVGVVLARAGGDAGAGAVLAGGGLPYAFVGGALLAAPDHIGLTGLGAADLLLGSVTGCVLAVLGYVGVAGLPRVFMAGITAGLAGILAAALCLAGMSAAGSAAVVLTVVIGLLPGYPLFAGLLGKLPMPDLPDRPEAILEDRPVPKRSGVFAAVARATELLCGLVLGAATIAVLAGLVLVLSGSLPAHLLVGAGGLALLLRGRLFPAAAQRIPLLAGGAVCWVLILFSATLRASTAGGRLTLLILPLAGAGLVLGAALAYSRRTPSPYVGRIADIVDVLAIIALIPITCAVAGVYHSIQGLFASFGG